MFILLSAGPHSPALLIDFLSFLVLLMMKCSVNGGEILGLREGQTEACFLHPKDLTPFDE